MKSKETDRFLEERMLKYDKWLDAGEITYASKVVPVRESIEAKQWIMPNEQALEILRSAKIIALNNCECRSHYQRCDNPLEVCFLMDEAAVKKVEKGSARFVFLEEAEEVLRYADKKGLVHLSFYMPGNKIYAFCSCCYCCCHDLQLLRLYNRIDLIACSEYIACTDIDACTDCGECIDRCFFGARKWKTEKMHYNPKACYGCGLCIGTCLEEATVLKKKLSTATE